MPEIASSLMLLAMTVVKGVQRDFPLAGDWGCPPAFEVPQDWGIRGLIETISVISASYHHPEIASALYASQ